MTIRTMCVATAAAFTIAAGPVAALTYQPFDNAFDVSSEQPDGELYFGDGNDNGSFTIATGGNIEVGLRAKLRFDDAGQPQNQTNWDGAGNYFFDLADGAPTPGLAMWNLETSIFSGLGGSTAPVSDYFFSLVFTDPFANEAKIEGQVAPSASSNPAVSDPQTSQGSQNPGFGFWDAFAGGTFDGTATGTFTASLTVFDCNFSDGVCTGPGLIPLASSSITINVTDSSVAPVPVPASLPLLAVALGGLGVLGRRAKAKVI